MPKIGRRGLAVVLLMAGLAGCQGALSPQAEQLLQSGYAASSRADHQAVVAKMDAFIAQNDRSRRADEAHYLRGLAKYGLEDRAGARADLAEAVRRTDHDELKGKAYLALADLDWDGGDMAGAENAYREALANLSERQPPADHAYYRLGCVLQRQGRWEQADIQFSRVLFLLGDSELAQRARRRIHSTAWTIQVAAYRQKARAVSTAEGLQAKGMSANVKSALSEAAVLFLVQVGRYPTYEQAELALPSIKADWQDAFVTDTR